MNPKYFIHIFIGLLFFSKLLFAQTIVPSIQISDSIITIDNQKYNVHIVEKKQTLYSIAKAYKTSVEDIIKYNPEAKDGLSIHQALFIPYNKDLNIPSVNYTKHKVEKGETIQLISKLYGVPVDTIIKYNPEVENSLSVNQLLLFPSDKSIEKDPDFYYHLVKEKETIYSISKLYNVKSKLLYKHNPHLNNTSLQIGQYVKLPKDKVDIPKEITDSEEYIYHKVERKQTLYSISKLYEIEMTQIVEDNSFLSQRGPITGELLKIKNINYQGAIVKDTSDSSYFDIEEDIVTYECNKVNISESRLLNVALLLPLYSLINDTLGKVNAKNKIYPRSRIFIDFYKGALLALDTLKEKGYKINLQVLDTENDTNKVKEIIVSGKLSDTDLIFGPMYAENINLVSEYAKENKKYLISPLSVRNNFLKDNPYAFLISPDFGEMTLYAEKFLLNLPSHNYIIIHDGSQNNEPMIKHFKKNLLNKLSSQIDFSDINYHEINYYSAQDTVIEFSLYDGKENMVIIPSSNQAFVSSVLSKLNAYTDDFEIKVFGMPRWLRFQNIEPTIFHNLEIYLFTNTYLDYKEERVKEFIRKYRNHFNAEPSRYSYRSYDIFYFFIQAFNTYGENLHYCVNNYKTELLQTDMHFKKLGHNQGLSNTLVYLLFFNHEYNRLIIDEYPK